MVRVPGGDAQANADLCIAGRGGVPHIQQAGLGTDDDVFGGLGLSSIAISFVSITAALIDKLVKGVSLIQSPLLLLSAMLFIIGVELILMGFIAEIGVRTYHESQAKPTYVVRRVLRQETTNGKNEETAKTQRRKDSKF